MSKLHEINISGKALSDLFFNTEKPASDELHASNDDPTKEQADAALLADAKAFIEMLGVNNNNGTLTPEALVADYVARL